MVLYYTSYILNADRIIFITHIRISIKVATFLLLYLQVYCLAMERAPPVEGTLVVLITKTWFYHASGAGQSMARMMQSLGVVHCWESWKDRLQPAGMTVEEIISTVYRNHLNRCLIYILEKMR